MAIMQSALQTATAFCLLNPSLSISRATVRCRLPPSSRAALKLRAFSGDATENTIENVPGKPSICTADELHHVSVSNSDWRLALWRYTPPPEAPPRNHPLLLLSGVGTNAIGYDLAPGCSFARYMSCQGFDTWILEFRGAGLSAREAESKQIQQYDNAISEQVETIATSATDKVIVSEQQAPNISGSYTENEYGISTLEKDLTEVVTIWDESTLVVQLTETFIQLSELFSGFLTEGQLKTISSRLFDQISKLLEDSQLSDRYDEIRIKLSNLLESRQKSTIASQIRDLSQSLVNIIEEGQRSFPSFIDLQERFSTTIEDFQKQLELIVTYDWDFDHYLEEDVPAAMEYVKSQSKPKDGKLLAVGHSMGGILLYAMLSRYGFEGRDPGLAAVVTLASTLDYTSSESSLKLLLPLADHAQALNVPAVPLGTLLAAAYPLSSRPPYVLSWLNPLISAEDMMHPELLEKLVLNNFCTIPAKLVLQLTTAFKKGGLTDRSGKFFYKDHLHKMKVPVLALAGDQDLICPPEAVYETVDIIPEHLVTYKVFGGSGRAHYAHYDLVGGRLAAEEVYPCIIQFLDQYDRQNFDQCGASKSVVPVQDEGQLNA